MTEEELEKATGQELIDERDYCGVDGYYGDYLDNVNAEMHKRFNRLAELEEQIADIKANCDLAIEGRDIKIKELELELTVEKDQHQEEINLHLHAKEYIKSLEEENNKLLDVINNQDVKIADLEKQLEKMRNCKNCKNYMVEGVCGHFTQVGFCKNWEMQE